MLGQGLGRRQNRQRRGLALARCSGLGLGWCIVFAHGFRLDGIPAGVVFYRAKWTWARSENDRKLNKFFRFVPVWLTPGHGHRASPLATGRS
jgi:hypothetical protein